MNQDDFNILTTVVGISSIVSAWIAFVGGIFVAIAMTVLWAIYFYARHLYGKNFGPEVGPEEGE